MTAPVIPADVAAAAATYYGLTPAELICGNRAKHLVHARQVAMYVARRETTWSLRAIADEFGVRDRGTVDHACQRIALRLQSDPSGGFAVDVRHVTADAHRRAEVRLLEAV